MVWIEGIVLYDWGSREWKYCGTEMKTEQRTDCWLTGREGKGKGDPKV